MKFNKEILKAIMFDDSPEGFKLIEEGDWISEGKYEYADFVFLAPDKKHYRFSCSRSGSHYTDWYYENEDWAEEEEVTEVKLKEVTTKQWVAV